MGSGKMNDDNFQNNTKNADTCVPRCMRTTRLGDKKIVEHYVITNASPKNHKVNYRLRKSHGDLLLLTKLVVVVRPGVR